MVKSKKRKPKLWVFGLIFGIFCFDLGFFVARLLPDSKSEEEIPQVDLILALTGGQGRIKEAFHLLRKEKAPKLLVSGLDAGVTLGNILEVNGVSRAEQEFFNKRVWLDYESRNTLQNMRFSKSYLREHSVRTLILVTSTYHQRRAHKILEKVLNEEPRWETKIIDFPVESPNFPRQAWIASPISWYIVFQEYIKSRILGF